MSDESSIVPPPVPAPEAFPAPPGVASDPAPKRRVWPWIVGGAALLLLLAVGVVVVLLAVRFLAPDPTTAVNKAVIDFDVAYENADCQLFEQVTSGTVRDEVVGSDYTCAAWQEIAESLTIEGEYLYLVEITGTVLGNDSESATVTTNETYNKGQDDEVMSTFHYELERAGDGWIITSYEAQE